MCSTAHLAPSLHSLQTGYSHHVWSLLTLCTADPVVVEDEVCWLSGTPYTRACPLQTLVCGWFSGARGVWASPTLAGRLLRLQYIYIGASLSSRILHATLIVCVYKLYMRTGVVLISSVSVRLLFGTLSLLLHCGTFFSRPHFWPLSLASSFVVAWPLRWRTDLLFGSSILSLVSHSSQPSFSLVQHS